ncbi:unnamed protein product, partial [Heterotrigona itama]
LMFKTFIISAAIIPGTNDFPVPCYSMDIRRPVRSFSMGGNALQRKRYTAINFPALYFCNFHSKLGEEIDYCTKRETEQHVVEPPSRRFAAATEIGACKREPPKRDLLEFRFLREWTPCSRFFVEKIAGDRGSTLHMYGLFVSRCQVLRGELNLREKKEIRGRSVEREYRLSDIVKSCIQR